MAADSLGLPTLITMANALLNTRLTGQADPTADDIDGSRHHRRRPAGGYVRILPGYRPVRLARPRDRGRSSASGVMKLAPAAGRFIHQSPEDRREVRLRLKTDAEGDFNQWGRGVPQHLPSAFDPPANHIFVRLHARCRTKLRRKVHAAEPGAAREIRKSERF